MTDANSSLNVLRDLPDAVKRPMAGFASQVYGLDENGRPKFWTMRKGNVDDLLSMPTLAPDLLKLGTYANPASALPYVGAPSRKVREWLEAHGDSMVPEFSRNAERRQRALKRAVRQEMQLSEPQGLVENTLESIGTMAGQVPIPATKGKQASSVLRKIFGAIPEYLGPTIVPKAHNYLSGALAGGAFGALGNQSTEDEKKASGGYMHRPTGLRPRGALRFGTGGGVYFVEGNGPFGLQRVYSNPPASGTPTSVTSRVNTSGSGAGSAASSGAGNAATGNTRVGGRMRAAPLNMDDYLNYGMRAAKKFYIADGGPVRQADVAIDRATEALRKLSARVGKKKPMKRPVRRADGGKAGIATGLLRSINEALTHMGNRDVRQALETLGKSKEAMAHPEVAKARDELRYVQGRNKGTERLKALVSQQGPPLGLADGGEAEGAMPESSEDPQMLYVEMQQLIAAVQSGRLSPEEEAEAAARVNEIEQVLTAMGVQLPGIGDGGDQMMQGMGGEEGEEMMPDMGAEEMMGQ